MTVARYGLAATYVLAVAFGRVSVSRHSEPSSDQTSTSGRATAGLRWLAGAVTVSRSR
ncbi:hypothetical protein ACI2KV_10560 [Micromonospora chokoriensis]